MEKSYTTSPLNHEALFLSSSQYCNFTNPYLEGFVEELKFNDPSQVEAAVNIFNWVRDNISYELGLSNDTATQTLTKRRGSCTNKANLIVAMARAAGIPAAFNIMRVKTRLYFGPVCTPRFAKFMSEESLHVFSVLKVNDKWLRCDGTDDKILCLNSSHLCRQSKLVHFDGQSDAMIDLDNEHIALDDRTLRFYVDDILGKKIRVPESIINVMNLYLTYIRLYGKQYKNVDSLEADFFNWLQNSFPTENEAFLVMEKHLLEKFKEAQENYKNATVGN